MGQEDSGTVENKVRRFVQQAWAEPPAVMDVTLRQKLVQAPQSEDSLRKSLRSMYANMEQAEGLPSGSLQKKHLESAVRHNLEKQGKASEMIVRYRYCDAGRRSRMDQAPLDWESKDCPFKFTFVNPGVDSNGSHHCIKYDCALKTASHTTGLERRFWFIDPVWRMGSIGLPNIAIIRGVTGDVLTNIKNENDPEPVMRPNPEKSEAIVAGDHDRYRIDFAVVESSGATLDQFTLRAQGAAIPSSIVLTSMDDPSRVHRIEYFDPGTGKPVRWIEAADFDGSGFPGQWREVELVSDGFQRIDERFVTEIRRDTECDDELFRFTVPEGFLGVETRPDEDVFFGRDGRVERKPHARSVSTPGKSRTRWLFYANLAVLCFALGFAWHNWRAHRLRRDSDSKGV